MATRTVLQLITKTCSINAPYSTSHVIPLSASEKTCRSRSTKQQRSFSQPVRIGKNDRIIRTQSVSAQRNISRSVQNFKETRYVYEDEIEETKSPYSISTMQRDPRRCQEYEEENLFEGTSQRYEIADSSRETPGQHFFDVCNSMRNAQSDKMKKMFPHLQPSNMKPYGSSESIYHPMLEKQYSKIVYPTMSSGSLPNQDWDKTKRQYSVYMRQKVYPGYEETNKVAVCEKQASKKNYSTTCSEKNRHHNFTRKPPSRIGLVVNKSFTRRSSTSLLKKKSNSTRSIKNYNKNFSLLSQKVINKTYQQSFLDRILMKYDSGGRGLKECTKDPPVENKCGEFITVKLGELQEQCRQEHRCKPKKINFGRLPKFTPPDCPCLEEEPLKEGNPLLRLKKRYEPKERRNLDCDIQICTTPRADANYKVVRKTLPKIKVSDCPCVEKSWTDFKIKRLPKADVPEPPKTCPTCDDNCCEPQRADGVLKIERKTLPKLKVNNCPCIETVPLEDVPLNKLKAKPVKEPPRPCPKPCKYYARRADDHLKIEPKSLPKLKPKCVCIEPEPPADVKPLKRLRKIKYVEKRVCPPDPCEDVCRADKKRKTKKKTLPKFVPQDCPCIEGEMPDKSPPLRKLEKRNNPVEKPKICIDVTCDTPRADANYKISPKKLPEIKPGECPCIEFVMKDTPPLKRLPPVKIKEPEKVCPCEETCCDVQRADDDLQVTQKQLPALQPGNCPCIEPPVPEDAPPLSKLNRRPVKEPIRECPKDELCDDVHRADDNLEVKQKTLPKLKPSNCKCIEDIEMQPGKPLERLPKVEECEPIKDCPKPHPCDEIPRADKDDWTYWKRRKELRDDKCPKTNRTSTRNYSTSRCAMFDDSVDLKYDVSRLGMNKITDKAYDIVIDIKPSPPLVLTQSPIELNRSRSLKELKSDYVAFVIYKGQNLGGSRSNPNLKKDNYKATEMSALFNTINRFISTYSTICQQNKLGKDHQTPSCECPPNEAHLQPKNPIIQPVEHFFKPYPSDEAIVTSTLKSRWYERTRKDEDPCYHEKECAKTGDNEEKCEALHEGVACEELEEEKDSTICGVKEKELTLWEKIVNYFKARPGCPTPEEFRKMRLREEAEKAAEKAGLCLYDPKEMLRKNEELPKVITAGCRKDDSKKNC